MKKTKKYFIENGLTANNVRSIHCERTRLNYYEVSFRLKDDSLERIGSFSGEKVNVLFDY